MKENILKKFREENKLTQRELSSILGYKNLTAIQKIECGDTKVPLLVERTLKLFNSVKIEKRKKFIEDFVK